MNKQIEIMGLETYWACPVDGCEEKLSRPHVQCAMHTKPVWDKAYASRWQVHRQVYFYCGNKIDEHKYREMLPDKHAKKPGLWEAEFCQHCYLQLDEATGDCINNHLAKQASCSARWKPTPGWTLNDNRVDGAKFARDFAQYQASLSKLSK